MWKEIKKLTNLWKECLELAKIEWNRMTLIKQMERKDYVELMKVIEALWWKWNKKEKCHIFDIENLQEAIDEVCDIMEVVDIKVLYQQYYTPSELAKKLVELSDIKQFDDVLEPSAWQGAIVKEIIKKDFRSLFVNEIDENNLDYLFDIKDEFRKTYKERWFEIDKEDFLNAKFMVKVNKIIANPPFTKSQDVKHILEMYKWLKEWWRIVSIASSSIQTREWKLYEELAYLHPKYIEIEDWAFKESWTMVNSVIVIIDK